MPRFSDTSTQRLATCNVKLQHLFNEVIRDFDCIVICGHRSKEDQERAFEDGCSRRHWPHSKHNLLASRAVDVAPYHSPVMPIDWQNRERFCLLAGWVLRTAREVGVAVRWGGDWNSNMCVSGEALDWDSPTTS